MSNQQPSEELMLKMLTAIITGDEDMAAEATLAAMTEAGRTIRHGEIGEPVPQPTDVYRVELGPNGYGPFNSGLPEQKEIYDTLVRPEPGWPGYLLQDPSFLNERMGVTERAFKKTHGDAWYGCACLASVNTWFPAPSRSYLASLGAKIVHYQLPAGSYLLRMDSAGEVIFAKTQAKKVEELPIDIPIDESLPVNVNPANSAYLAEYNEAMKNGGL
jgi:hypothetical protein